MRGAAVVGFAVLLTGCRCGDSGANREAPSAVAPATATPAAAPGNEPHSPSATAPPAPHRFSDRQFVGQPVGEAPGVLMFRGNPTRTYYGTGPALRDPQVRWRYPSRRMCGDSDHHGQPLEWCGTGWTGQPVIWERPDGVTELIFGSYDKSVHFVDAATGAPTRSTFETGDIVKGSPTLDPDGYPLYYFGSRDNNFRILALDRDEPTELWRLNAYTSHVVWNDDWDGNAAIVDDLMFLGGENGWFYIVQLNRGYDDEGLVTVDPDILVSVRGWTDAQRRELGPELGIESSVALYEGRAYFANSGGRVVGLDLANVDRGEAPIVFDYLAGDDVDASIVIDEEGMLYVASEVERGTDRSAEVGQLLKLDPYAEGDPRIWGVPVPLRGRRRNGIWATPALFGDLLYVPTHDGDLLAVDRETGDVVWSDEVGFHAWSSPLVVDGQLVVAIDCARGGGLRGYDLSDPRRPTRVWELRLNRSCIESTPILWRGVLYVGSRDGFFYAFADDG